MDNFHILLFRAFHTQRNYLRPKQCELGLSPGQPRVLGYLLRNGACCQRELAEHSEVDPATICRMLDTLEKGGLVSRQTDSRDRRTGQVSLTEKGRQVYLLWQEQCIAMEQVMLQDFTEEEKTQFAAYLQRAYQNLGGKRRNPEK